MPEPGTGDGQGPTESEVRHVDKGGASHGEPGGTARDTLQALSGAVVGKEVATTQPYDAESFNHHGAEGFLHNTSQSMGRALQTETPDGRVFSHTTADFLGADQRVGFINEAGKLHVFALRTGSQEVLDEASDAIWGPIKSRGLKEADGLIRVDDETGDVYEMYETDRPDEPETVLAAMDLWLEDVKAEAGENPEGGFIQYLPRGEEATIVDYTVGKRHKITALQHPEGSTLDKVKDELPDTRFQDNSNSPVIRWSQAISNK